MTLDVITIDGPAGSGKSTLAKRVAERLNWAYLDSGALYRAIAWILRERQIPAVEGETLAAVLRELPFELRPLGHDWVPYLGEQDLRPYLRSPEVSQAASQYSALPSVRAYLLGCQRAAGEKGRLVCDGRDMGSVVFPQAKYKVYLDASPAIRAERRFKELLEKRSGNEDISVSYDEILAEMTARDLRDRSRAIAPLAVPKNAMVLDTSGKSIEDVLYILLNFIDKGATRPL